VVVPSEALAGLAGAALFVAPGSGLAEMLPSVRVLPPARRLAWAYLLGVAWTAGILYALSHFLGVPLRRPAIFAVAALPVLAGLASWLLRRHQEKVRLPKRRPDLLTKIAVLAGVAVSLGILADTLTHPQMEWDGRMTWSAQARYIRAEGTVDASVLTQPGWYVSHPWYPLLLPVAQAAVLELGHAGDDAPLYRALFALFFPAWLLLLYSGARRWAGRRAAALTCLAAALLPFPAFHRAGGATGAYSDLPLACFYGAGLLLLLKPRPRRLDGLAAGLLLGAAVLTKAEGAPLALAAVAVAALSRRRFKAILPAAVPVALAFGLLFSWRAGIPARFESYQEIVSWDRFWPDVLARAPFLLGKIRAEMISIDRWGFFWSVWPLVLLAGWRGLRRRVTPALALAALAPLGIAWIAYTISLDPAYMVRASWSRFLIQASVPLLLLLALALRDLLRRSPGLSRSPRPHPGTPAGSPEAAA
jgi:hypothetical protein